MKTFITQEEMLKIPAEEISENDKLSLKPVVSVVMMTYNHENFIFEAVRSVLEQKSDFSIELLIGDDCSPDNTRVLCEKLQKRYPNFIRLFVAPTNVGITNNFLRLVCRARGKYIALLEGDDYWTDKEKLQKQVALMEDNSDYSWCGAKTVNRIFWVKDKKYYTIQDVLSRYIFHTSSILFRSNLLHTFPHVSDMGCLDFVFTAYLSEHGKCGFLNEEVSYYRRHEGGVWTGSDILRRVETTKAVTDNMDAYFDGKYKRLLYDRELWIYKMDTAIRLAGDFRQHWLQSVSIVRLAFPRMMKVLPVRYFLFASLVMLQPVTAVYLLSRRKLAIRKRMEALKVFLKHDAL